MIQKTLASGILAAAMVFSAPASATTTITLTGGSGTHGTAGNVRQYSNGGITVQATGWSLNGSTPESAFLGAYSNGLGVTNSSEGTGGNNSHAVDNYLRNDFILLVFNQAVTLASARLNPYGQNNQQGDNDVSVSYTNFAGLFASPLPSFTAISGGSPVFGQLNANLWNVSGNMSAGFLTNLNSGSNAGNVWLIGAARTNPDQRLDGFKLSSITVRPAVPEPGTWAMMLIGFGAVGYSMRRARRTTAMPQLA